MMCIFNFLGTHELKSNFLLFMRLWQQMEINLAPLSFSSPSFLEDHENINLVLVEALLLIVNTSQESWFVSAEVKIISGETSPIASLSKKMQKYDMVRRGLEFFFTLFHEQRFCLRLPHRQIFKVKI